MFWCMSDVLHPTQQDIATVQQQYQEAAPWCRGSGGDQTPAGVVGMV